MFGGAKYYVITRLITPAATYPVSVADLKSHLVIEHSDDDTLLSQYIAAATAYTETDTSRAFVSQTWELVLPGFYSWIALPKPPCISVSFVKYYDTDDALTTLATSEYRVIGAGEQPSFIEPVESWPSTYTRSDGVVIRYVAGYSTMPTMLVQAIKLICGTWYENREGEGVMTKTLEQGVDRLLGSLKVGTYV